MIDHKIIEEDLQTAIGHYYTLKKKVYLYFSAALLTGVLATLVAALAASNAPLFGKGDGWRWNLWIDCIADSILFSINRT